MNCLWGYVRTSTAKQHADRQIRNILNYFPDARIVTDEFSGVRMDRPGWQRLVQQVRSGDTIVFDEVSRLARDATEGFQMYKRLYGLGVELVFLKERHIDTEVYRRAAATVPLTGTLVDPVLCGVNEMLMMLAEQQIRLAFERAESEVELLHQRTREGMEIARRAGKQIGRPAGKPVRDTKKAEAAKAVILRHSVDWGGTLSDQECMRLAGCSRNSFYKYKRELRLRVKR